MANPTRYTSGVSSERNAPLSDVGFGVFNPRKWHMYFNDFNAYSADDWLETVVDTDVDGADTRTIDGTAGGVLNILNNDNAADSTNLRLGGDSGAEQFLFPTGKKAVIGAKFSSTDVDKNYLAVALVEGTDVDFQGGLPNDHIAIEVDSANAEIDISVSKDGTATTQTNVGTLSDYSEGTNNLTEVILYYNGSDEVQVWVDGAKQATLSTDNWPDDEAMGLGIEIHNSDAAADAMAVDWVLVAVER